MQYLVDKLKYFQNHLSLPSVEALLALKDNLYIPDDQWHYITSTFQLGPGSSLHYIKKHCQALNQRLTFTVEKFRNYSLESKHSCNKAVLCEMMNHFKMGEAALVWQQLQVNMQLEEHQFTHTQNGEEPM